MSFKSKSKPPAKSNVALLTEGASYIRRAKNARKGEPAVEKVVFDDDARREYLTGFSKRKKAKVQEKRDRATKKAHEDHLAQRRQAREDLKQRARENFISVRRAMGLEDLVEDEADEGIFSDIEGEEVVKGKGKEKAVVDAQEGSDNEDASGPVEVEYEDGDLQAVVTITDDFDDDLGLGGNASGLRKRKSRDEDDEQEEASSDAETTQRKSRRPAVPLMPASSRKQQKKALSTAAATKKTISLGFPSARTNTSSKNHVASDYRAYESKAERKKVKEKERGRHNQKWELAKERGTAGGGRGRNSARGRGRGKAPGKGKK